ncbi:MAG TPA: hypothetical protein VFI41_05425 [Gemmatimonadales bacterium]|nr:hypothetical protein [Gemmatimonadales bacterium]
MVELAPAVSVNVGAPLAFIPESVSPIPLTFCQICRAARHSAPLTVLLTPYEKLLLVVRTVAVQIVTALFDTPWATSARFVHVSPPVLLMLTVPALPSVITTQATSVSPAVTLNVPDVIDDCEARGLSLTWPT